MWQEVVDQIQHGIVLMDDIQHHVQKHLQQHVVVQEHHDEQYYMEIL